MCVCIVVFFFFSSRRRHTRWTGDWSSDVCSSDLPLLRPVNPGELRTSQSKLSIEDADLSKLLLRLRVRLPMRTEAESKKDRAPTRNPPFRQRPGQLPRREAGNKKGRVPMVNP